ncbi:GNAT family N-acetyltransferase [Acidovorax sp.]|uniref:GNAT family N-acetyltransferase n=1 Tax=Acidovorax sp. TaxID=1872122 RepID=UPI00391BDAC9
MYSLVEPEPAHQRQCVLKELFVSPRHRSQGIGLALMQWVARYALDNGCGRIDWSVKSSNARGIAFYKSLGARLVGDRLSFRMVRDDIGALTAR